MVGGRIRRVQVSGWANVVTFLGLASGLYGLAAWPRLLGAVLLGGSLALDLVDGLVARKLQIESAHGAWFDFLADMVLAHAIAWRTLGGILAALVSMALLYLQLGTIRSIGIYIDGAHARLPPTHRLSGRAAVTVAAIALLLTASWRDHHMKHEAFATEDQTISYRHVPDDGTVHGYDAQGAVRHEPDDGIVHEMFDDGGVRNVRHVEAVQGGSEPGEAHTLDGAGSTPAPAIPETTAEHAIKGGSGPMSASEKKHAFLGLIFRAQSALDAALQYVPPELEELRTLVVVARDTTGKLYEDAQKDLG